MNLPNLWSAPEWIWAGGALILLSVALLAWSYWRARGAHWLRLTCAGLKTVGLILLVLILMEPKRSKQIPVPGANLFMLVADKSESLTVFDRGLGQRRDQQLVEILTPATGGEANWAQQLVEQFDVRRYTFDKSLHPVQDYTAYTADGLGSSLKSSLQMLSQRVAGRPCAGILLLTDGIATDAQLEGLDWEMLPPVYPVLLGSANQGRDLKVTRLTIKETNFEAAPVLVTAEMTSQGYAGKTVVARLIDANGKELQRKTVTDVEDNRRFAVRFEVQPIGAGVHFYQIQAAEQSQLEKFGDELTSAGPLSVAMIDRPEAGDLAKQPDVQPPGDSFERSTDVTWANNVRALAVDRARGPYRVLYVGGRPNWEFKFLNRALYHDEEVDLVGLLRVARREPKFSFRGHIEESTNPLFRGFGNQRDQAAEQYDEPVMIRIGTRDREELLGGFPQQAEDLFGYDAIILDDIEAGFFTQEQMSLMQEFVSLRGGTLMMFAGQESFGQGGYDRTPVGDMLPVYLDRVPGGAASLDYRWSLTREGQLQPWVRVRRTEAAEAERLNTMTGFRTVNRVTSIKPGATVLAEVNSPRGDSLPALVTQSFGEGKTAALLVGDYWRWHMTEELGNEDLAMAWRQMARWLVADVPQRVQLTVEEQPGTPGQFEIRVAVRDQSFQPELNARIELSVMDPTANSSAEDQQALPGVSLTCQAVDDEPGVYMARFLCRQAGEYVVVARVRDEDSELGRIEQKTGWVFQPSLSEFESIQPNSDLLDEIATKTGGRRIAPDELEQFAASIPVSKAMVTQTEITPWWHQWQLLAVILVCLVGEWGLRRWKGLA